jgi:hypothetical protein
MSAANEECNRNAFMLTDSSFNKQPHPWTSSAYAINNLISEDQTPGGLTYYPPQPVYPEYYA